MTIFYQFYECIINKNLGALKKLILENQDNSDFDINSILLHQTHGVELPPAYPGAIPITLTLTEFTILHLAVTEGWQEGVIILMLAGADPNITLLVEQLPITVIEIANKKGYENLLPWLASSDLTTWFKDEWIEPRLSISDTGAHRGLFIKNAFLDQTQKAVEKYQPIIDKRNWIQEGFLLTYWQQCTSIPKINKIKLNWQEIHQTLRTSLFQNFIEPFLKQSTVAERIDIDWQSYVDYLYTPAGMAGDQSEELSHLNSSWYDPAGKHAPAWIKKAWEKYPDGQLEIQELLNKFKKSAHAVHVQKNILSADNTQHVLAQFAADFGFVAFSNLARQLERSEKKSLKLSEILLDTLVHVIAANEQQLQMQPKLYEDLMFLSINNRFTPDLASQITPYNIFIRKQTFEELLSFLSAQEAEEPKETKKLVKTTFRRFNLSSSDSKIGYEKQLKTWLDYTLTVQYDTINLHEKLDSLLVLRQHSADEIKTRLPNSKKATKKTKEKKEKKEKETKMPTPSLSLSPVIDELKYLQLSPRCSTQKESTPLDNNTRQWKKRLTQIESERSQSIVVQPPPIEQVVVDIKLRKFRAPINSLPALLFETPSTDPTIIYSRSGEIAPSTSRNKSKAPLSTPVATLSISEQGYSSDVGDDKKKKESKKEKFKKR